MDIKPMLSMDVIKKYVDNIDHIRKTNEVQGLYKQRMTQEELKKYDENLIIIKGKYGQLTESVGGVGGMIYNMRETEYDKL